VLAIKSAILSIGLDKFSSKFWDKAVAFIPRTDSTNEELRDILNHISAFLDRTDIRYPSLRLVKDGKEIPLEDYTTELRIGPHSSHDLISNELVFNHYNNGATIVLQMLQNSLPSFGECVNEMEGYFSSNVNVSCFITPPEAQGFTAHYDTYSFFAVQLFGEKKWSLYNATELLPIREDRENEKPWVPTVPEKEITIGSGDVMYVPRGRYHSAVTSSSASIHLTVGIFSPNWIDITKSSLAELQFLPKFRESTLGCPSNYDDEEIRISETEQLLRSKIDLRAGIKRLDDRVFSRHVDSRKGRLHDLLILSKNELLPNYELQPIPYRLTKRLGLSVLQFADKELQFPEYIYPVISAICATKKPFKVEQLPKLLDDKSFQILLRKLVAEGFLHVP
jgi:hypothetical protein